MGSSALSNDKAARIAELRAAHDATVTQMPSHAITARSRALLSLVISILEGKHDDQPARPAEK